MTFYIQSGQRSTSLTSERFQAIFHQQNTEQKVTGATFYSRGDTKMSTLISGVHLETALIVPIFCSVSVRRVKHCGPVLLTRSFVFVQI